MVKKEESYNFKKYTKNQFYHIGKMLIDDFLINNMECIKDKENRDCYNKDCYACILSGYVKSLEDNTYLDKFNLLRCVYCQEEIEEGYCKCKK